MVLKETIIFKHIIKPSSPTPDNLKIYKISYLDQIVASAYIPLIFFYENDESKLKPHAETSRLLKNSLSHILTICCPFAGTIHGNSHVDCDDTGVEFIEARVHAHLAQVIDKPEMVELKQLVPVDSISHTNNALLLVKLNFFDCGGIALAVCLSHKVADFASLVVFMNAWAATCREETCVTQPSFDLPLFFPPRDSIQSCFTPEKEEITTKRLVFNRKKLEKLKKQMATCEVKNPTRVEALSVFMYQQFMEAHKALLGMEITSSALHHSIHLRPRAIPPIPNHTIGSCSIACFSFLNNTTDSSDMLTSLRTAIRAVDDNYIKKVVNTGEYLRMVNTTAELFMSGTVLLGFTSWLRFPVYDVDFGWGKPCWVGTTTMPYKNTVILMSTHPSEDGIEAWVNMSEDFFHFIEANCNKLLN